MFYFLEFQENVRKCAALFKTPLLLRGLSIGFVVDKCYLLCLLTREDFTLAMTFKDMLSVLPSIFKTISLKNERCDILSKQILEILTLISSNIASSFLSTRYAQVQRVVKIVFVPLV